MMHHPHIIIQILNLDHVLLEENPYKTKLLIFRIIRKEIELTIAPIMPYLGISRKYKIMVPDIEIIYEILISLFMFSLIRYGIINAFRIKNGITKRKILL